MMDETTGLIQRILAGKSLEEATSEGLLEKWSDWGSGFISTERWITIVYNSYSAE